MRVFGISDLHADYAENREWIKALPRDEYAADVLLLAGDISDDFALLQEVLATLRERFARVLFVAGNHDLWVHRGDYVCSLEKKAAVYSLCAELEIDTERFSLQDVDFVPLQSWYDFSFGKPDANLNRAWRDFRACQWPENLNDAQAVSAHFLARNEPALEMKRTGKTLISCSHFLPTLALMPNWIPESRRRVYPVLGSTALGEQIRRLRSDIHLYGHSHVNQALQLGATYYVNNAFATPKERRIAAKQLRCLYDSEQEPLQRVRDLAQQACEGALWS